MFFHRQKRGAFTIVELLIAAAITTLIVVLLGTMLGSLTSTASRASRRIDAFRDARAALQIMEHDLSALVLAPSSAYFALDKRWKDIANDSYSDPANGNPNRQLFALISTRNAGLGDVCAAGYYCRWDTTKHTYSLYRCFADSTATFNVFKTVGAGNYASDSALFTPSVTDDLLATDVWNLQVVAFKPDGSIDSTYPLIMGDPANPSVALPAAIEISFNAMSSQAAITAASVITSPADWMTPTTQNYKRFIAPNAYEFRTRIKF